MDSGAVDDVIREQPRRPVRNRRYTIRRSFGEEKRPPKRLFTPEIKRFLKDWLVRRRENPYPNREEKKELAIQTGLTYIQVCNWFANWRRKLKNAGKEPQKRTWGDLIKTYNSQVHGNVEHFSICSEDSIWEEPEMDNDLKEMEHCYTSPNGNCNNNDADFQDQCCYISSTTNADCVGSFHQSANKYKRDIMEKYLRDCQQPILDIKNDQNDAPSMISKWLESATNFKPSEHTYLPWTNPSRISNKNKVRNRKIIEDMQHGREEIDAAEALTNLANARFKK